MDLDTAKRVRDRLKEEITALTSPLSVATLFSKAPQYVDYEIIRLGLCIDEETISSITDGYEVKIPVENEMHILFMCGLSLWTSDLDSIVHFKEQLVFEHQGIERCHPPFPFISQYIKRMIERLEDEIEKERARAEYKIKRPKAERMPPPYSRFFIEHLKDCVKEALHTVLQKNPEDHNSDQVLDILRQKQSFPISHYVRSVVREMYYEATFPINTKPEPEVHGNAVASGINKLWVFQRRGINTDLLSSKSSCFFSFPCCLN